MATDTNEKTPTKAGAVGWLVLILAALLAIAGGFSLPLYLMPPISHKTPVLEESKRPALIPFGEIVVNLGEERLTRYLRAKLLLVVDDVHQKKIDDLLLTQKPFLKSWLISYLSDQSLQEVSGAAGVNRVRRQIRDKFNSMLFPDGSERIQDILFDEFVVQ